MFLCHDHSSFLPLNLKARDLFLAGVELERAGELFSAVQKYKRAVQMVPDIEHRVFDEVRKKNWVANRNPMAVEKGASFVDKCCTINDN